MAQPEGNRPAGHRQLLIHSADLDIGILLWHKQYHESHQNSFKLEQQSSVIWTRVTWGKAPQLVRRNQILSKQIYSTSVVEYRRFRTCRLLATSVWFIKPSKTTLPPRQHHNCRHRLVSVVISITLVIQQHSFINLLLNWIYISFIRSRQSLCF